MGSFCWDFLSFDNWRVKSERSQEQYVYSSNNEVGQCEWIFLQNWEVLEWKK